MPDTYTNKLLVIDLSRKSFETIPVSDLFKTDFIGGKGFGAKLLSDMVPPGTDPLGKDNPLMFMTGPLTGTMAPAMRGCVVTKSPLTGIFLDSYFGGSFSPEIKYAGFDGINPVERSAGLIIEDLIEEYFGRLFLIGGVCNIQILPRGGQEAVRRHIEAIVDAGRNGGLIVGSHSLGPDIPVEAIELYRKIVSERGAYRSAG